MRRDNADFGLDLNTDTGRRVPSRTKSSVVPSDVSVTGSRALAGGERRRSPPRLPESSGSTGRTERNRAHDRRARIGHASELAVLSVRLLATESDIEETLPLALAAHSESRHREYPFDAERRRRFLAERFLADPMRYGFLIARHGERAVGMLTCHAQNLVFSDVTVASCLSFYVQASCRRTLLGGRVAVRLVDAGRRWAMNRGAVEWQMHVTSGVHIGQTDRLFRRLGFRQTGGNYAMGLSREEIR